MLSLQCQHWQVDQYLLQMYLEEMYPFDQHIKLRVYITTLNITYLTLCSKLLYESKVLMWRFEISGLDYSELKYNNLCIKHRTKRKETHWNWSKLWTKKNIVNGIVLIHYLGVYRQLHVVRLMGLVGYMSICIMIINSSSSCFPSWIIHVTSFSIVTKGFIIFFFGWKDPCQELWFMHWQLLNILFIHNKIFSLCSDEKNILFLRYYFTYKVTDI